MKMKRWLAVILASLVLGTAAGCSQGEKTSSSPASEQGSTVSQTESSVPASSESSSASSAEPSGASSEETEDSAYSGDPDMVQAIAEVVEEYEFQGVIYIAKDGKPAASYASGKLTAGEPIAIDTFLPIGSTSKQFCAVSVLMLMEQGKLSLDDTIDKYFPTYAEGGKIAINDLLSMRSGLVNTGMELLEVNSDDMTCEENMAAYEQWIFEQSLLTEPGTTWYYSNCGYYLLAEIVEQVSGKPYHQFVREEIFTPLEMKHTGFVEELKDSPAWAGGIQFELADDDWGITQGAGDIVSNGEDMTKWMDAIRGGSIISKESYQLMTTDYSENIHYGYGLFLELAGGGVGHGGTITSTHLPGAGTVNYSAYDYIQDEQDLTIFWASNSLILSESTNFLNSLAEAVGAGS